jgi:drug/metabolite transporter (DMT)-like permease
MWNLLIKKNPDPQLGFLCLTILFGISALIHGLWAGVSFIAIFSSLPLIAVSVLGQLLYGNSLTATLKRGDLSAYYPIIRASPIFVVAFSVLFLGKSYALVIIFGIALVVAGGYLLLYRRGTSIFKDPAALGFALVAMSGSGIYSLSDAQLMQTITPQALAIAVETTIVPVYAIRWYRQRDTDDTVLAHANFKGIAYLILPGIIAYSSYYLILLSYQSGGDVASVTSLRQASIPISVALGGLFLREGAMARRFFAASILAFGIILIAVNG